MALPTSYHWRNLLVRKTTSVLNVLVIAAVVGVFTWMLGFANALRGSLMVAGDDHKLIVIKYGATAESNSIIPVDEYNKLSQLADVARDPAGEALISPELLTQVSLPRLSDGGKTTANVAVRGVTGKALQVHRNVKLHGNPFSTGTPEVIVGESAARQFGGLGIGEIVNLGYGSDRGYRVVGTFSANGGPMESEIWGYLPSLMNAYSRTMYSSANLRLRDGTDPQAVIEQIRGPSIQLAAQTEKQYWRDQSANIRTYLMISYVLVGVMSLAAILSVANTMFSMVAGRTSEIAMLRTIGFSGAQILGGFVIEALLLSLVGGLLGCLACAAWLVAVGNTKDMFAASTFTTLAFEITLTPIIVVIALLSVSVVGVLGALLPARRAARLQVVSALRG